MHNQTKAENTRKPFVKPPFGSHPRLQQYYCSSCRRNHHIFDWNGEITRDKRSVCGNWFDPITKQEVR